MSLNKGCNRCWRLWILRTKIGYRSKRKPLWWLCWHHLRCVLDATDGCCSGRVVRHWCYEWSGKDIFNQPVLALILSANRRNHLSYFDAVICFLMRGLSQNEGLGATWYKNWTRVRSPDQNFRLWLWESILGPLSDFFSCLIVYRYDDGYYITPTCFMQDGLAGLRVHITIVPWLRKWRVKHWLIICVGMVRLISGSALLGDQRQQKKRRRYTWRMLRRQRFKRYWRR